MSDKIIEILEYGSEGYLVDFKQEEYLLGKYPKKHEFLKDISAMANHPKDEDKYIIIGAVEKNGMADSLMDIPKLTDQAQYQEYLNAYIEPAITFEYKPIIFKGKQLAYFRIFDNKNRPYLFKKAVQMPKGNGGNQMVFKEGDGFIKTGSGTKKMVRSDFERIYRDRFAQRDRSQDISISAYSYEDDEFQVDDNVSLKVFDLDIENHSNKSINFDIELKLFDNEDIGVISRTELKRQNSSGLLAGAVSYNFHVEMEKNEGYTIFRRSKMRYEKTAVSIPQGSTDKHVFDEEIIAFVKRESTVLAELTTRCDEFTEGALIQKFEFE